MSNPDVVRSEDPEAIRDDIERTREDLGDTVAALAEKTDVKARARDKVTEVREALHGAPVKSPALEGR